MTTAQNIPAIAGENELADLLTRPGPDLIRFIRSVASPLLVLGAGGKMGPTLAVMAKRAATEAGHALDVIAVSRFSDPAAKTWLEEKGVQTISCDLLDAEAVRKLPEARDIIYLVGLKFGTSKSPSATWAMNTLAPANVMLSRSRGTRIVALSTGNVYPFSAVTAGGAREDARLIPLGEYPNAAVARERIFEFFSLRDGVDVALLRLFYAVELRYGVLVDIARKIISGEAIDVSNSYFNCIWQGDANEMIIRSLPLASSPPSVWNLCQPEIFSVRTVAAELGERMGCAPLFKGTEQPTALLGNADRICNALGRPTTPFAQILRWTADWVKAGGRDLGRPTHFEVRDGVY